LVGAPSLIIEKTIGTRNTTGHGIFLNKRVLQHDYVPQEILHREAQAARLEKILSDIDVGARPRNPLVVGSFGTGKTVAVLRYCRSIVSRIQSVYVNCSEQSTQSRIIREILRQLGDPLGPGFPKDYYLSKFKSNAERHRWLILVLDEVDKFVERRDSECDELFYTLSRTIENVVTIMLTNRVDLERKLQIILDSRVKDTFRYELVEFPDYTAKELMDILRARCILGLRPGSYDEGVIAMIGRRAYELGLRARGLLDTIRKAAELADAKMQSTVTEQDVRDALKLLSHENEMEIIQRLPLIQKAILGYILESSPTLVSLYEWYRRKLAPRFDVGPSRTRLQDHIKQLTTLGLAGSEKHGLGRGRGQVARIAVPQEMVETVRRNLEREDIHPTTESATTQDTTAGQV
jgi:cell division control protein 6